MICQPVEFHGVAELRTVDGLPGRRLQRVPEDLRCCLNQGAQERTMRPAGAEIRFVCDTPEKQPAIRITLSAQNEPATLIPFWGPFQANQQRFSIGSTPRTIELTYPERLTQLPDNTKQRLPFSPKVWRLVLRNGYVHFHEIEGPGLRPPRADELPSLRYLTYGTSITQGAAAMLMHNSYTQQTARRLGADLINLGVGGSAHCEPEFADYIASRDDWHFATLGLSVNMIGAGFTVDQFHQRASYMVNTIAGSGPRRPVTCITLFPYFDDLIPGSWHNAANATAGDYREALRDIVSNCPHGNVHLVEGPDLLTDIGGLTEDLLHPGDHGMIQIGENLARRMAEILRTSNFST